MNPLWQIPRSALLTSIAILQLPSCSESDDKATTVEIKSPETTNVAMTNTATASTVARIWRDKFTSLALIDDKPKRAIAEFNLIKELALIDIDSLIEMIDTEGGDRTDKLYGTLIGILVDIDLQKSITLSKVIEDEGVRKQINVIIYDRLVKRDPKASLDYVEEMFTGMNRDAALRKAFSNIADNSLSEALALFKDLPYGSARLDIADELISRYASVDVEATLAWMTTLGDELTDENVVSFVDAIGALPQNELKKTMALIADDEQLTSKVLKSAPLHHGGSTLDEGMNNALSYSEGSGQESIAQKAMLLHWAGLDPQGVVNKINSRTTELEIDKQFVSGITSTLVLHDPLLAAEWSTTSPPSFRKNAVATTMRTWIQTDPLKASEWAGTVADPNLRDVASIEVVNYLMSIEDINSAQAWSNSITDKLIRTELKAKWKGQL